MRARTRIIIGVMVAGGIWFALGWVVAGWLAMPGIDRVTFLLCQGVVFVLGATLVTAWLEPKSDEIEGDRPKSDLEASEPRD